MFKTAKEAIAYLEEIRGTHVEDLRKIKYRVYDENFTLYVKSDKELIDYANDQKADQEQWDGGGE